MRLTIAQGDYLLAFTLVPARHLTSLITLRRHLLDRALVPGLARFVAAQLAPKTAMATAMTVRIAMGSLTA
jgi:hypothetical protein